MEAKKIHWGHIVIGVILAIAVIVIIVLEFKAIPTKDAEPQKDAVTLAREEVIKKWGDGSAEGSFFEDTYKKYLDDEVIATIYYYSIATDFCKYYEQFEDEYYIDTAKEYAAKISPDYSGEYAEEIHDFVDSLISPDELEEKHDTASSQEDKYNNLTNNDKKAICQYIQGRYDYYDSVEDGYSGDKYSDTIMEEASNKYGLSIGQIKIIWGNQYSY